MKKRTRLIDLSFVLPYVYRDYVTLVYNNQLTRIKIGKYCSLSGCKDKTTFNIASFEILETEYYTIIVNTSEKEKSRVIREMIHIRCALQDRGFGLN